MKDCVYRISDPVTVVVEEGRQWRLKQLSVGSQIQTIGSNPDGSGLIRARCEGEIILIFTRDLQDCAHPAVPKTPRRQDTDASTSPAA